MNKVIDSPMVVPAPLPQSGWRDLDTSAVRTGIMFIGTVIPIALFVGRQHNA